MSSRRGFRRRNRAVVGRAARSGAVLVIAVLVLAVICALGAAMLKRASLHRRDAERSDWKLQADWLAESGLSRAVARMSADPAYQQETWIVPADDFGGSASGRVQVSVTRDEQASGRRSIVVIADYPDRPDHRARSRRRISLDR